jgi:glycosyltransferase involved in cell wall biosynthesis
MTSMRPILTIAIPTYNRASILENALNNLLPQLVEFSDKIELIISDNASLDNTQSVISEIKIKYPSINIVMFLQSTNTGYFGNFKKCKELASGFYIWLLSDNEHLSAGVVKVLMNSIQSSSIFFGAIYLAEITKSKQNKLKQNIEGFNVFETDFKSLIENETAWLLTSISSVVFLNDKSKDDYTNTELPENLFLGFLYLCNSLIINSKILVIHGKIYNSFPCKVYFDIFKAWTKDILECVDYAKKNKLLSEANSNKFIEGYLKNNLQSLVLTHLIHGSLHGVKYGDAKKLAHIMNPYYGNMLIYKKTILKKLKMPRCLLLSRFVLNKILKRLKKLSTYIFYKMFSRS